MNLYPDSTAFVQFADSLTTATPPEPVVVPPAYTFGNLPVPTLFDAGDSTPVVAMLVGLTVLLMLFAPGVRRTLKHYKGALWSLRRRPNVFDTETGVSIPVAILLTLVFMVFTGTDIYLGLTPGEPLRLNAFFSIIGLVAFFYIFKLGCYWSVGYAFSLPPGGRQWLTGYNAAMAYIGLTLIIPTFLALYIEEVSRWILLYCAGMWLVGQIIFICKGFRIFYQNYGSIFYFFLYLCTLELIPLFALASAISTILSLTEV